MAHIFGGLARSNEVTVFSQPRPDQLAGRGSPFELPNRSRAAALLNEPPCRAWPTAPLWTGATLRLAPPRGFADAVRRADVAMVEFPWQFAATARQADGCRLVLTAHNVEIDKFEEVARAAGRGPSARPWLRAIERVERRAVERADLVLAVSEPDRDGLVARYRVPADRVVVAPNGADVDAIRPAAPAQRVAARRALGLPDDRPVAIFAGARVTQNLRGVDWVRELGRRTDRYTLLVVGKVGGEPRREGPVVYTGFVEDFPSCLAAADVALCPIEFGGGTKIKLIESLAAGLPTIAFRESIRGMAVRDGEHLLVAEKDAGSLLGALDRLTADPQLASRIGAAGRRHAEEHHDWRAIAGRVEDALSELVEGSPRRLRESARAHA
jgi:glycosyltransferase involved in cell wall biosynthesis